MISVAVTNRLAKTRSHLEREWFEKSRDYIVSRLGFILSAYFRYKFNNLNSVYSPLFIVQ